MANIPRKRWDRIEDHLRDPAHLGEVHPPFTKITGDMLWMVFRIDPDIVRPLLPEGVVLSDTLTGVLGVYELVAGWPFGHWSRCFGGVAVQGYDSPDTGEAVYITGDVVSAHAAPAVHRLFDDCCVTGTSRVWRDDDLLRGSVSNGGSGWLDAAIQPKEALTEGITGVDAYLGLTKEGLTRHLMTYVGGFAPADVTSLSISEAAPVGLRALRPSEIVLGLQCHHLQATWGAPYPARGGISTAPPSADRAAGALRALGLTPAESRLANVIGEGHSVRQAAQQLGISENTARSTLKIVYGKLGVRKQSELSRLITRLQFP